MSNFYENNMETVPSDLILFIDIVLPPQAGTGLFWTFRLRDCELAQVVKPGDSDAGQFCLARWLSGGEKSSFVGCRVWRLLIND